MDLLGFLKDVVGGNQWTEISEPDFTRYSSVDEGSRKYMNKDMGMNWYAGS